MTIRTHTTGTYDIDWLDNHLAVTVDLPDDWPQRGLVTVVAGLEPGCELRRLCDVPTGWEWCSESGAWHTIDKDWENYEDWTGLVVCRPRPEPAIGRWVTAEDELRWYYAPSAWLSIDRTDLGRTGTPEHVAAWNALVKLAEGGCEPTGPADDLSTCESCGAPATVRLDDGSTWCHGCDGSARRLGYHNGTDADPQGT